MNHRTARNPHSPIRLIAMLFLAALGCGAANAVPIVDQSNLPGPPGFNPLGDTFVPGQPNVEFAQTFTVGLTGRLTRVEVVIINFGGSDDVSFDLRPLSGGFPEESNASAIVTKTIPNGIIPGSGLSFTGVDLTADDIFVTAGEQLAFSMRSTIFGRWMSAFGNTYAGGDPYMRWPGATTASTTWQHFNNDIYFQTFVDAVPEPGSIALLALGLAALGLGRRKRA